MVSNTNTMYVFCEVMEQLEPQRMLDIGMFYKAIGGVSRSILDREVPPECNITGVDFCDTKGLCVYKKIYDEIVDENTFLSIDSSKQESFNNFKKFDLAVILSDAVPDDRKSELIKKAMQLSSCVLLHGHDIKVIDNWNQYQVHELKLDDDKYVLVVL